jgi:energy-coupling factor transporter transmembrane protein EcfT
LDGKLMSLIVILVVSLGLIYRGMGLNRFHYFLLFMTLSVLVNVKLTAGIYASLLVLGYLTILWFTKKIRVLRQVFTVSAGAFLLGFMIFGFSPYVTNTLSQGNPFYPALGTDRSDYTAPQFPSNFTGRNSAFLLFFSIFAKSDNVRGPDKIAVLKVPFTVSSDELRAFTDTNAKQGGFGPLFGGAILLTFLVFAGALIDLYRSWGKPKRISDPTGPEAIQMGRQTNIGIGLFYSGLVLLSCLINPASSLARFIPQMWLLPIFAFFLAYLSKNRLIRFVGYVIIMTLILNNALVAFVYYRYNCEITRLYHQRLGEIARESKENPMQFHFGHFRTSNVLRFEELGIAFKVVDRKEECTNGQRILPNSIILKCTPP